jgi:hypothetical protein
MGRRAKGHNALFRASETKELSDVFGALTLLASEEVARGEALPGWYVGIVRQWVLYERARIENGLIADEQQRAEDVQGMMEVLTLLNSAEGDEL